MQAVQQSSSSFEALFAAAVGLEGAAYSSLDIASEINEEALEMVPEVIQAVPEDDTPPTVGEQYKALWVRYRNALENWANEQCEIRSEERRILNRHHNEYMRAFEDMTSYDVRRTLESRAAEIRKMMVWTAEKVFAPEGVSLKIDGYDIHERFRSDEDNIDAFDPVAIWSYLEQKYGGDFGEKLAWQQVARGFKSKFNLDEGDKVVIKNGYIVLERSVWLDDFDKKQYKKNRLAFGCVESISQSLNVLSEIARWSDRIALSHDLHRLNRTFSDRTYEVQSRAKHPAGDNGEVIIVTYTSRFEFLIRQDFAEQLQVFLGTYLEIEP
ncbi:hypothetical protein TMEC54S_00238 [Thauera mechernichensis]